MLTPVERTTSPVGELHLTRACDKCEDEASTQVRFVPKPECFGLPAKSIFPNTLSSCPPFRPTSKWPPAQSPWEPESTRGQSWQPDPFFGLCRMRRSNKPTSWQLELSFLLHCRQVIRCTGSYGLSTHTPPYTVLNEHEHFPGPIMTTHAGTTEVTRSEDTCRLWSNKASCVPACFSFDKSLLKRLNLKKGLNVGLAPFH